VGSRFYGVSVRVQGSGCRDQGLGFLAGSFCPYNPPSHLKHRLRAAALTYPTLDHSAEAVTITH
jgi:hypothetical protein